MLRFSQPQMVPLYTDLTFEDTTAIVRELEARAAPYELRREGQIIMVPKTEVLSLRMALASDGLPLGVGVGYEIFDKGDTLSATSFVQNLNHLRALEGELARTIRSIDRVQMARVHLVLPGRELFRRDNKQPTASIVLRTRGDLDKSQIRAIQHLAAAAVDGLQPGHVSVVDENGRLLADGRGDENPASAGALEERRLSLENNLRQQIEHIVSSIVGTGRARVQVAAELDFNRITQTSDIFDPEGRVLRSSISTEETTSASRANGNDGVSVGNELPGANQPDASDNRNTENANKAEEVVNYEISRTQKTEVVEAGRRAGRRHVRQVAGRRTYLPGAPGRTARADWRPGPLRNRL